MKCVICKEGEYKAGLVTVVLTRDESTVVLLNLLLEKLQSRP